MEPSKRKTKNLEHNEITVISWNVESGGADSAVVAQRIASMQGVDLGNRSRVAQPHDAWGYFEASTFLYGFDCIVGCEPPIQKPFFRDPDRTTWVPHLNPNLL
jgi:hypothetical protein